MDIYSVNDFPKLSERIAFMNGLLNGIGVINSTSNNIMEHWLIALDVIDNNVIKTIETGINAKNWGFESIEITDWHQDIEKEGIYFFANLASSKGGVQQYYEQFNFKSLFSYFIFSLGNLLTDLKLSAVYRIEIDTNDEPSNPYFAHGELNYAFEIDNNKILYLHFGAYD